MAQSTARRLELAPASFYLLRDAPGAGDTDEHMLPRAHDGMPVYSAVHLADALWRKRSLDVPRETAMLVASLVERELCRDVALFVSDPRSALGRLMVEVRRQQGRAAALLNESGSMSGDEEEGRPAATMAKPKVVA